jgi:tripartite-type tricarboxylate transporter receptor subunit TctC
MKTALLFLLLLSVGGAQAQSWPTRPLKLIVPFPPGGGTDLASRSIAARLGDTLGQPVVVENRPGAGGTIGAEAVAKSAPDGYTIGTATSSTHPAAVALQKDVPYDPVKSFAPITRIGSTSFVLLGTAALPANSFGELVAYAKANPGKLNVANVGSSTLGFLMTLQLRALTGTAMTDVYYKGSAQVYPDLISGQIQLFLDNPGTSTPLVTSGKLRGYGVTTPTPSMPGVPLFADAGLKGFDASFWYGLVAPAGTPKTIVDRIQADVARYVHSPEGKAEFAARSLEPGGDTPEQFTRLIQSEMDQFRALAVQFKLRQP